MLELYHANHSTCSQKVRLCMAEKGLNFKSHLIDLGAKGQLDPEYMKINPNGVVPSLVHDNLVIIDSSVICEYLDEVFPENPLTPDNAYDRARMRKWMRYIEEVPTAAVRFPSFNMAFLPRFDGLDEESFIKDLISHNKLVTIFLISGIKLEGTITSSDATTLTLKGSNNIQLVYKHAVSTILPV